MYELRYVKKRKAKIIAAISAGVATTVISTFAIVSFLGRYVGTFTVSLDTGKVELALSEKLDFKKKESYLRIDTLPSFHEFTYSNLPSDEVLDSEETNYLHGAIYKDDGITLSSMNYFKYTFYVRNVGKVPARYNVRVGITDNKAGEGDRSLDDTLRVLLFETNMETSAQMLRQVYAKKSAVHHIDDKGNADFREAVSVPLEKADSGQPFLGYAEMFETKDTIATLKPDSIGSGETRRYTIVNWLEGYDPQSDNFSAPPKGARLKLGVEINAYEN